MAQSNGITPAQLGFLTIFNPSLGSTDDTIDDQIVYYTSLASPARGTARRRHRTGRPLENTSTEERNERLRQIGLAQGMVDFGKGFADGRSVDVVDTDKARVVVRELEPGWWLLASIDLTKISLPPRLSTKSGAIPEADYEYSSREMKPADLLLRDLLRAHSIFLMHHDSSLSALFVRSRRSKFVAVLSRYWDLFLSTWNVMLHGNPTRDAFAGINLAASGELGMGVGEEERGSGEREVLEGLVGRIEGLIDVVVSKFGAADDDEGANAGPELQWLGTGQEPGNEDGSILPGTGVLSKRSVRDITHWMEDIYTWGEQAYGVVDSPTSLTRKQRRRAKSKDKAKPSEDRQDPNDNPQETTEPTEDGEGRLDKMVGYLKLGYGSYWAFPGGASPNVTAGTPPATGASDEPGSDTTAKDKQGNHPIKGNNRPAHPPRTLSAEAEGHFLIGLKGEIEESSSDHYFTGESDDLSPDHNSRTVVRTLNVELEGEGRARPDETIIKDFLHPASALTQSQVMGNQVPGYDSHNLNKSKKVRVVVYVNKPFIFTFLFQLRTDSLAWDTMYRSLHYQLSPLKKSLIRSISYRPEKPNAGSIGPASDIYDLVWDSRSLTVQSSIPNIPETWSSEDSWSRTDALSTHLQLLNVHHATRLQHSPCTERTCKTNRGWWVVWTRVRNLSSTPTAQTPLPASSEAPPTNGNSATPSVKREDSGDTGQDTKNTTDTKLSDADDERDAVKEIFLVRKASDHSSFRSMGGLGGDRGESGAGKLAQGIGVDTRRYVEELLSLL